MIWDDVRVFLAIHRLASHQRAARQLGVNATTVGRRIVALERALGARLFVRTPEGLLATPAGLGLVPHAERMEKEAIELTREIAGADRRLDGVLRVTASDGLLHYALLPALTLFRRQHPHVSFELRSDTRALDLSRREADIALRLSRPKEPALVARRVGELRLALFASRDYLALRGTPRSAAALSAHDWVGFEAALDDLPQVKWLRRSVPAPRYAVRTNTTVGQVVACAEGHGIALLPLFIGEREPRLERLLPRLVVPSRDLWSVIHADLRGNARTEAFLTWLEGVLGTALG